MDRFIVVDRRMYVRESLVTQLSTSFPTVPIIAMAHASQLAGVDLTGNVVAICGQDWKRLRLRSSSVRIIVLAEPEPYIKLGIDSIQGLVTTDSKFALLTAIVRLVAAGGEYLPHMQHLQYPNLSIRQKQVIGLLPLPNKAIADRLGCSPGTVKTHIRRLFARFAVTNRTALVAKLYETYRCLQTS